MRERTGLRWLWVSVIVLLLDRFSKYLALEHLPPYSEVPICPHFNLALSYNTGAAFSFLDSASGWQTIFFGVIAAVVSIAILIWLAKLPFKQKWLGFSLALILGGALGNLSDRLMYGHVIDFIQLYYNHWYWPTFNVADSAVCVGAFMLFIEAAFFKKK